MKNLSEILSKAKSFIKRYRLYIFKDVALFILITVVVHFSYRFWVKKMHYWPIKTTINNLESNMSKVVYYHSAWFVENVLNIEITCIDQTKTMYFVNNGYISVNRGCSGFKPILQFIILMMFFTGSLKNKLWFIPLGVLAVHLTNLFRIIGLSVVITKWPEYWDFSHDYLFRPFFYVVIFLMWVWWVEKLAYPKKEKKAAN